MSTLAHLVEQPRPPKSDPPSPPREEGDHIEVFPYNAYYDPLCAHSGLAFFWDKLREHGLLKLYYPDLTDDDRLFPTFVRMMSSDSTKVVLVLLKDSEDKVKDLIGIATWEPMRFGPSMIGHAGFIFRQEYWTRRTTIEAGKKIMEHWFTQAEPKLDVAVGLIARDNIMACRYVKALGWQESGWIHRGQQYNGNPCDAVIFQYTRDEFEKGIQ